MNPLVSVIIPVYNVKPFLREALDSVIGQTYRNLEIIIIDDGSTDESGDICEEYSCDSRVTVIHQDNKGLSGARNTGLDLFRGDYLCFLDPDDAYHPAFVETLLNNAQNSKTEMVVCKFTVQKTVGKLGTIKKGFTASWPRLAPNIYSREDALRSLVEGELNDSVWNRLYKADLWSNIRFPEGHNYEDTDVMYRILDECQMISMIDEILLFYREHSESITHDYSVKNARDWMLACHHFEDYIQLNHPSIFSDDLVEQYKQRNLNEYMGLFAKSSKDKDLCNELLEKIVEKGNEIEQWNIRTKVAFLMVCYAPWLFRCVYKIYLPYRLLVWKVTGR